MNNKVLKTLEFNKIIDMLKDLAYSKMAKGELSKIVPSDDIDEVMKLQHETSGAKDMINYKGAPSFGNLYDIDEIISRLDIDALLSSAEILRIVRVLECTSELKSYYNDNAMKNVSFEQMFENLVTLIDVQNEVKRCIISEDEIADDASVELRNIRRQLKNLAGRAKEKLTEMLNSQTYRSMLQEPVITIKDERYCLPVKAEYKSQIKGIVHDESSTGATLFIEPMAAVETNNKIKEFERKEQEEIERILFRLSYLLKDNIDTIKNDYSILIKLDVIFAKGKLSQKMDGIEPKFNERKYINLKLARHPLIEKDKVVPINLSIGKDYSSLIITGPNTGGKTVTLKTLGLLSLLGQAGLHIPAYDGSELTIFNQIYADIGDEQSIEQSLSTFSSHMKNTVEIIREADENSLVLMDELGAGTDPVEGAALAVSILRFLKDRKSTIVATTHYSEIKHYALTEKGVINAACEFDIATLSPTYRLLIGMPGKSNAFEISRKLGLPEVIIDSAKSTINRDDEELEDAIKIVSEEKTKAEEESKLAEEYRAAIERQKEEYEYRLQKLKEEKEKVMNDARSEALKILEEEREKAKDIITNIKRKAKELNMLIDDKELQSLKKGLDSSAKELEDSIKKEKEASYRTNDENIKFKKGMDVYISSLDKSGTVVELPDSSGMVLVLVGIMKVKVDKKYIFEQKTNKKANKFITTKTSSLKASKQGTQMFEINVVGMYPSEALGKVEKFIDDAVLMNIEKIRIVHGKGSGVLRKEIHNLLSNHMSIDSYRLGEFGEGDSGVTIVTLK